MAKSANETGAADVDAYIAAAHEAARPTLAELRRIIRAAAPEAREMISYGIPSYKQRKMVVAFGAAAKHCGLYAMSPAVLERFKAELEEFSTAKGTVRFPLGEALPEKLITQIVKARLAENLAAG